MITEIIIMAGLGFGFGFLLAYASKKFAVKKNPLVEKVREILPGANCGACGLAGCDAFAEAVVAGKVPIDACVPGQKAVADKIAEILGGKAPPEEKKEQKEPETKPERPKLAPVKVITEQCIGCGICVKKCPKEAIKVIEKKAVIKQDKCIKCGICINACPKKAIVRE